MNESRRKKISSSQVSWALLTQGVTEARLEIHRLHLLLDRATALVENSENKESIYQHAGDLILGVPRRLEGAERALDRTAYALTVMGEDFLRGRLPLDDRILVDDGVHPHPEVLPRVKESRVVARWVRGHAPSAEEYFFDTPENRETRQFAESKALSNDAQTALSALRHTDTTATSPSVERRRVERSPSTPEESLREPGAKTFGTLSRYLVDTEQQDVPAAAIPGDLEETPRHPRLGARRR